MCPIARRSWIPVRYANSSRLRRFPRSNHLRRQQRGPQGSDRSTNLDACQKVMDDRMRRYNAGMNAPTVTNEHSLNELIKFEPEILALRIHRARFASGNSFQTNQRPSPKAEHSRTRNTYMDILLCNYFYRSVFFLPFPSFSFFITCKM